MRRKTPALPIRSTDFSDTSQIVVFLTREFGFVEAIAKGSYREKSSFEGPFDLAVLYEVVFSERRAGLSVLTESTVLDGLRDLRRCWPRHVATLHVLEFLRTVAVGGGPDRVLFDLVLETLHMISLVPLGLVEGILARFDARALHVLGLLAPVRACVGCGKNWPGGSRPVLVSPRMGGVLCSRCRSGTSVAEGLSLPGAALDLLGVLTDDSAETALRRLEAAWPVHSRQVREVVWALRDHLLEKQLTLLRTCPLGT